MIRYAIYGALIGVLLTMVGAVSIHMSPVLAVVGLGPGGFILGTIITAYPQLHDQISYAPGILFFGMVLGFNVTLYSIVGAVVWSVRSRFSHPPG